MAAPYKEESIMRLRELPIVIPKPLSSGSQTNLPYKDVLVTWTFSGFIISRQFIYISSLNDILITPVLQSHEFSRLYTFYLE
jgi:hypothetical protein